MAKAFGFSCVAVFALLVLIFIRARSSSGSNDLPLEDVESDQCAALIGAYHSALEATFEVEVRSGDGRDEWHRTMNDLTIRTLDYTGQPLNPTSVVDSVIRLLEQKIWHLGERQRLEYILLGRAMPLDAREKFDDVCIMTPVR